MKGLLLALFAALALLAMMTTERVVTAYEDSRDTAPVLKPAIEPDHPAAAQTAQATSSSTAACKLQRRPAVRIEVSAARWPHIADHINDVDQHYPRRFHLDRTGADENRDESLAGYPTRTGYDRDEYPPALSAEGGEGAQIRYVPSSENRSQGSVMGNELEPFCNGSHFRLVVVP